MPRKPLASRRRPPSAVHPAGPPEPDRLARLEDTIAALHHELDVQLHRIAALQVEVDLLKARKP